MYGLDFETASSVDLKVHGLDRYVSSPDFRVLCASVATPGGPTHTYDFIFNRFQAERDFVSVLLKSVDDDELVAGHNVGFERAVLRFMRQGGVPLPEPNLVDSAVTARAWGASSALAAAGPQLLDTNKMDVGVRLIKKFCTPRADGTFLIDDINSWTPDDFNDWGLFLQYCDVDSEISRDMAFQYPLTETEMIYELRTQSMNDIGWRVDLDLVHAMQKQYQENLVTIEEEFRTTLPVAKDLNFRSPVQLQKFCRERGVRVTSLDEQHTADYLARVTARMDKMTPSDQRYWELHEVQLMLMTKQALGGSSLSKLQVIIDTTGPDGRLRNQYVHVGAGQSYRTSGRGVQMQNLKRLREVDDVEEILRGDRQWSNDELARNLRQVFTAEDPQGELVVGDLSSIESRGLAYIAGELWKLTAYEQGRDMYKVLASSMLNVPYAQIDKDQRQRGKVGELSCGYGAGAGAVSRFAQKMGMDMDEDAAAKVVSDWREANPMIVDLWAQLDSALHEILDSHARSTRVSLPHLQVYLRKVATPASLTRQYPGYQTIALMVYTETGDKILTRIFQGVHKRGRDICYVKPVDRQSGSPWTDTWHKNGQTGHFKLYGGKLAGILTQSFCREIFFSIVRRTANRLRGVTNARLIGQFHDELIIEWQPPRPGAQQDISLDSTIELLHECMTEVVHAGLPMAAEVKHAYRYIK